MSRDTMSLSRHISDGIVAVTSHDVFKDPITIHDVTTSNWSVEMTTVSEDRRELRYWPLLLLIFPLFTVFGNLLVCLSVYREKQLRTLTNYFIVSLAVSDIMVAVLVMPLAVYTEVSRQ